MEGGRVAGDGGSEGDRVMEGGRVAGDGGREGSRRWW